MKAKEIMNKKVFEHEGDSFTVADICIAVIMCIAILVIMGVVGHIELYY